jgi:hypothetical protein
MMWLLDLLAEVALFEKLNSMNSRNLGEFSVFLLRYISIGDGSQFIFGTRWRSGNIGVGCELGRQFDF